MTPAPLNGKTNDVALREIEELARTWEDVRRREATIDPPPTDIAPFKIPIETTGADPADPAGGLFAGARNAVEGLIDTVASVTGNRELARVIVYGGLAAGAVAIWRAF